MHTLRPDTTSEARAQTKHRQDEQPRLPGCPHTPTGHLAAAGPCLPCPACPGAAAAATGACVRACRLSCAGRESWMRCVRTARGNCRPTRQPACLCAGLSSQLGSHTGQGAACRLLCSSCQSTLRHKYRGMAGHIMAGHMTAGRGDVTGSSVGATCEAPSKRSFCRLHWEPPHCAGAWQVASALPPVLSPACSAGQSMQHQHAGSALQLPACTASVARPTTTRVAHPAARAGPGSGSRLRLRQPQAGPPR